MEGSFRFLGRVWRLAVEYLEDIQEVPPPTGSEGLGEEFKLRRKTHQTIRKVTTDIEDRFHFNTAISAVMELVNLVYQVPRPGKDDKAALRLSGRPSRPWSSCWRPSCPTSPRSCGK